MINNTSEQLNEFPKQTLDVDFGKSEAILNSSGDHIWHQGVILRKVSKFITGMADDAIVPMSVFYDPKTGEILLDVIPHELREELSNISTKTLAIPEE